MDSDKLNNWIQSISGLAILVGLGLIIWELQLNREAIQSQLSTEGFHMINQFHTSAFGDNSAEVRAKACENPGELTSAEFALLDHYYSVIAYRTIRVKTLGERGSFYTRDQWKTDVGQWGLMFESPAGRAYWRTMGPTFDPEIRSAGDAILANGSYPDCSELYSKWATHIQNELERQ